MPTASDSQRRLPLGEGRLARCSGGLTAGAMLYITHARSRRQGACGQRSSVWLNHGSAWREKPLSDARVDAQGRLTIKSRRGYTFEMSRPLRQVLSGFSRTGAQPAPVSWCHRDR
jgi:hypothetical protein